jgi:adenylate kinase
MNQTNQINKIKDWLGVGSINIFGVPFAGKDTQADILAELFGGVVIGGGDILRSHPEPLEIEKALASGGIVPHEFFLSLMLPYFSKPEFRSKPLILSSVGRAKGEEVAILHATEKSDHPLKAVVTLDLNEDYVWKRFELAMQDHDRGDRSDDHREILKTRLRKYQEETMPVIDFYREKGLLVNVNGSLTREQVTGEILNSLEDFITR